MILKYWRFSRRQAPALMEPVFDFHAVCAGKSSKQLRRQNTFSMRETLREM
jgi:hypothetical protein